MGVDKESEDPSAEFWEMLVMTPSIDEEITPREVHLVQDIISNQANLRSRNVYCFPHEETNELNCFLRYETEAFEIAVATDQRERIRNDLHSDTRFTITSHHIVSEPFIEQYHPELVGQIQDTELNTESV